MMCRDLAGFIVKKELVGMNWDLAGAFRREGTLLDTPFPSCLLG